MSADSPRIGSLFSGYGGLDQGVMEVLGGSLAWYADVCKFNKDGTVGHHEPHRSPCAILAHHHPDVPNLGDVAAVKWTPDCPSCGEPTALYWNDDMPEGRGYYCPADGWFDLSIRFNDPDLVAEPVEVITGGSPCQDLSHAGKRAGMTEGTRSNLWVAMREAIAQLRPSLVVWENVRGAYSAPADSELEPCPGCVGDSGADVALRALGRVLGDLSELGYDCRWHGLRAADVGAPHGRFRVFVVAYPQSGAWWLQRGDDAAAADPRCVPGRAGGVSGPGETQSRRALGDSARRGGTRALLPTPRTSDTNGPGAHGDGGLDLRTVVSLMPTPRATDGAKGGPNQRGSSGDLMLPSAVALLPTPMARDFKSGRKVGQAEPTRAGGPPLNDVVNLLPTPAVNDMGEGKTPDAWDAWDAWTKRMRAEHANGNGHGKSLSIEAQRLLPTPTSMDSRASGGNPNTTGTHGTTLTDATVRKPQDWGIYASAIARWERLAGPAPVPTQLSEPYLRMRAKRAAGLDRRPVGMRGSLRPSPQLSPAFSEWMMGLPPGHVTGVPSLSRNDMLKALGNGVVPQQAAAALRFLLSIQAVAS